MAASLRGLWPMLRRGLAALGLMLILIDPGVALADGVKPGLYRALAGPDAVSRLLIGEDGRFRYMLSAGALDEGAEGYWKPVEGGIALYTDPKPVAPEFRIDSMTAEGDAPLSLRVVWPGGEGIAGVDFRLGFADSEVITGYTQQDGWTLSSSAHGEAAWVEFEVPMHRIASPRFPIGRGISSIRVTLVPNDLGVVNFDGSMLVPEGKLIILHHMGGMLRYTPDEK